MGNSSSSANDESSKYKEEEEVTALVANCSPFKGDKAEGGGDKTPSKHTSEKSDKSFHTPNRTPQNPTKKSKNNHPMSYNMEAPEDQIAPTVTRTATLVAPPIFEELQPQPPSAVDQGTSVFGGEKMEIEEVSGIRKQQLQWIDSLHAQDYGKEGGTDQISLPATINQQVIINNPESYVKPDPESPIVYTWEYDRNESTGGRGGGSTRAGGINRVGQGNISTNNTLQRSRGFANSTYGIGPGTNNNRSIFFDLNDNNDEDNNDWIPNGIDILAKKYNNKKTHFILNKNRSVRCDDNPTLGYRAPYSVKESEAIFGPKRGNRRGIMKRVMPVYQTKSGESQFNKKTRNPSSTVVEDLGMYYCDASKTGCEHVVLICRCHSGILVYEKADGNDVPYQCRHNPRAHNTIKQTKRTNDFSWTCKHKEIIIEEYGSKGASRDEIYTRLKTEGLLSPAQESDIDECKRRISRFLCDHKKDYLMHQWGNDEMTQEHVEEGLDKIRIPSLDDFARNPSAFPPPGEDLYDPTSETENYFLHSNLYEVLSKNMVVIDHDHGDDGNKSYILYMPRDAMERAEKAFAMFPDEEGEYKNTVQIGTDFTPLPGTGLELGHAGFYDFNHRYWPMVYVLHKHENKETSIDMMKVAKRLIELAKGDDESAVGVNLTCLCDAAYALDAAARSLDILVRRCFAHVIRLPDGTKRNSKQGTKGSLYRYVRLTMKFSAKDTMKV